MGAASTASARRAPSLLLQRLKPAVASPSRAALTPIAAAKTARPKALDDHRRLPVLQPLSPASISTRPTPPSAPTSSRPGRSSPTKARCGARCARPMPAAVPVWRFFNRETGAHFYTTDAAERQRILVTWPQFADEGPAFHAYPSDAFDRAAGAPLLQHADAHALLHRARRPSATTCSARIPAFVYEGIAYYALAARARTTGAAAKRDAFRLVDQATFGPTPAEVDRALRDGRRRMGRRPAREGRERLSEDASSSTSRSTRARAASSARRATRAIYRCAEDQLTLFKLRIALLHQRAVRAPTSCASAWRGRCRRSSSCPA